MVFFVGEEELRRDDAWWYILRRHLSYFGDLDGLNGLLDHIGEDNPFVECLVALVGDFDEGRRRNPVQIDRTWTDQDDKPGSRKKNYCSGSS